MTSRTVLFLTAVIFAIGAGSLAAGAHPEHSDEHKVVIALQTDEFELAETDISGLEIGDAETIFTESGKTIDLLRTADGVEIYVDGELLDTSFEGADGGYHVIHKHVEVECDSDEKCEEMAWTSGDEDMDMETLHGEDHHQKVIIIKEKADTD